MKRKAVLAGIGLMVLSLLFLTACHNEVTPSGGVDGEQVKTLRGEIIRDDEGLYLFQSDDGGCYTLSKEPILSKLTNRPKDVTRISIVITYTGELTAGEQVQEITILSARFEQPSAAARAKKLSADMTLEEKIAQMFIARCPTGVGIETLARYPLGGYVLFGRDFESQSMDQITRTIAAYQKAADIPLLIAVDEEGGSVTRIDECSDFPEAPFLSPRQLFEQGGLPLIETDAVRKAKMLHTLGVNVNLAPVCDISRCPDDFMYNRSLGQDAPTTSDFVQKVVHISADQGVGSVLKHFPGYGNSADTHTGIAYDKRPYQEFEQQDFLPFQAGIEEGAGAVMVSHNIVYCMDEKYPASLSESVHQILRGRLGFEGVIMTDDLDMDAIKAYTPDADAAVKAVLAGNDLLCSSNYGEQIAAVLAAVRQGTISETRIDQSVCRILIWKMNLGLL